MKRERFKEVQASNQQNYEDFIEDLRESIYAHRGNLSELQKKDLEARISCLIEDLNYL